MKKVLFIGLFGILSIFPLTAQDNLWQKQTSYDSLETIPKFENFEIFKLNLNTLQKRLAAAPNRQAEKSDLILKFPILNNQTQDFRIYEASNFDGNLQKNYPQIRSYVGIGIQDPTANIRFSISPYEFYGTMYSGNFSALTIEALSGADGFYVVFPQKEIETNPDFRCEVRTLNSIETDLEERNANDGYLRTFRLAMATTSNYAAFHLQRLGISASAPDSEKKAAVLSAMNIVLTHLNSIFERDVGIHLQLIANTDSLIFLDPNTDPYTPDSSADNIAENIVVCNNIIGADNYDIGHVLSGSNLGGLAYVAAVCWSEYKAGAVSGYLEPFGDSFYNVVAHEVGHQFGANHSFNNSCGGNVSTNTSIEPGSGTTIMSYAGGCPPNVAARSIAFFNSISIQEMWLNITRGNSQCGVLSNTNNAAPVATTQSNKTIPKSTPFILEGEATDPDHPNGENLTYSWEQINPQQAPMPPQSTNIVGPLFLINEPSNFPYRFMPRMETIRVGATSNRWEVLPAVGRVMNFKFLVRDNAPGGGSTASASARVRVDENSGPFFITSQNSYVQWTTRSTETITWEVANTTAAPVNCSHVTILFSEDGGYTYPYVLAESVPNNGSATIQVPLVNTSEGRVMVRGKDNIFFDINDKDITVTGSLSVEDSEFYQPSLFPNPGSVFTLKFRPLSDSPIDISLYDLRGRLIDRHHYDDFGKAYFEKTYDYNHLEDGTYFLIIKNGGSSVTKKLIKK